MRGIRACPITKAKAVAYNSLCAVAADSAIYYRSTYFWSI